MLLCSAWASSKSKLIFPPVAGSASKLDSAPVSPSATSGSRNRMPTPPIWRKLPFLSGCVSPSGYHSSSTKAPFLPVMVTSNRCFSKLNAILTCLREIPLWPVGAPSVVVGGWMGTSGHASGCGIELRGSMYSSPSDAIANAW